MTNKKYNTGFALCSWAEGTDCGMVHSEDMPSAIKLVPRGKVFRLDGCEGNYIRLVYGETILRAAPEVIKILSVDIKLGVGDSVIIRSGTIVAQVQEILWHHKDNKPFFIVSIDGRRRSKRYFEQEFIDIEGIENKS